MFSKIENINIWTFIALGIGISFVFTIISIIYRINLTNSILGLICTFLTFAPITLGLLLHSKKIKGERYLLSKFLKILAIFIIITFIVSVIIWLV